MDQSSRIDLHHKLEDILGNKNVYFQPPESLKLKYPCIVYSFRSYKTKHADDGIYFSKPSYSVTVIYKDADSTLREDILNKLSYCNHNRHFISDNLYHDEFTVFN